MLFLTSEFNNIFSISCITNNHSWTNLVLVKICRTIFFYKWFFINVYKIYNIFIDRFFKKVSKKCKKWHQIFTMKKKNYFLKINSISSFTQFHYHQNSQKKNKNPTMLAIKAHLNFIPQQNVQMDSKMIIGLYSTNIQMVLLLSIFTIIEKHLRRKCDET